MNKVILIGRLTKDPETSTKGETIVTRFTTAIDRKFKKDEADFIRCVCFGKTAEFVNKYFHKGMKIALTGRIQTGDYEKDGVKHYTTDVVAEEVEFADSKKVDESGFEPAETEADLPFK